MAPMNEQGQWIVMLGFIISIILVFLALIVNQSALVGKTTAEGVLEFPKAQIQDIREEIMEYYWNGAIDDVNLMSDTRNISMEKKGAIINYTYDPISPFGDFISIHYHDGTTDYYETIEIEK